MTRPLDFQSSFSVSLGRVVFAIFFFFFGLPAVPDYERHLSSFQLCYYKLTHPMPVFLYGLTEMRSSQGVSLFEVFGPYKFSIDYSCVLRQPQILNIQHFYILVQFFILSLCFANIVLLSSSKKCNSLVPDFLV